MPALRTTLFWLHLCAALLAGLVILTLAATGLLLAFEVQIQAWADRGDRRIVGAAEASTISLESLLGAIRAQRPELPATSVTLRRGDGEAVLLALGREGVLYVDPQRGKIRGDGAAGVRGFFRGVTELHRFLGASGERRALGKATTGAATLLFTVILCSGLYLWLPKVFSGSRFRNALWFRRGLAPKARDFNWHHVFGIWALVPLLLIVVSALPISYDWAGQLVMRATGGAPEKAGTEAPRPPAPAGEARPPAAPPLSELDLHGLDLVVARAIAEVPDWRALSLRLPPKTNGEWTVTVEQADRRGRPDLRSRLVIAAAGEIVERESFASQSRGRRVRSWMRWIHTGEAGGGIGQAVAALACGAVLLLGWTGYALAWRRYRSWRERAATVSPRQAAVSDSNLPREPSPLLED